MPAIQALLWQRGAWSIGSAGSKACWRHGMEAFSVLLALCEGNPSVTNNMCLPGVSLILSWTSRWANNSVARFEMAWRSCDITVLYCHVISLHSSGELIFWIHNLTIFLFRVAIVFRNAIVYLLHVNNGWNPVWEYLSWIRWLLSWWVQTLLKINESRSTRMLYFTPQPGALLLMWMNLYPCMDK